MSRPASQTTGDLGESLVCHHLQQQNWQVLAQQWRCRWGEVDIIARKGSSLIFVEVKTRQSANLDQDGLLAINARKQRKLIQTASLFLSQFPQLSELNCRFDVALVRHDPTDPPIVRLLNYIPAAYEIT